MDKKDEVGGKYWALVNDPGGLKAKALQDEQMAYELFVHKAKVMGLPPGIVKPPAPKPKVYHTSKKDEWGTPHEFFKRVQEIFHLDLDAAATPENALLDVYLTKEMNSLQVQWWGRVWCNPPYSLTKDFVNKAVYSTIQGHTETVVLLVAARPDTQWFWYACQYAAEIRFIKGRLSFTDGDGKAKFPAPFPSCLLVFDRKCPTQAMGVWDWKQDETVPYEFGKEAIEGMMVISDASSLPPEVKEALGELQDLMGSALGKYTIVGKPGAKSHKDFEDEIAEQQMAQMKAVTKALKSPSPLEMMEMKLQQAKIQQEEAYIKKVLANLKHPKP